MSATFYCTQHQARRAYKCAKCGETIPSTTTYAREAAPGSRATHPYHLKCRPSLDASTVKEPS